MIEVLEAATPLAESHEALLFQLHQLLDLVRSAEASARELVMSTHLHGRLLHGIVGDSGAM